MALCGLTDEAAPPAPAHGLMPSTSIRGVRVPPTAEIKHQATGEPTGERTGEARAAPTGAGGGLGEEGVFPGDDDVGDVAVAAGEGRAADDRDGPTRGLAQGELCG